MHNDEPALEVEGSRWARVSKPERKGRVGRKEGGGGNCGVNGFRKIFDLDFLDLGVRAACKALDFWTCK